MSFICHVSLQLHAEVFGENCVFTVVLALLVVTSLI